ncbi:uncharacterized protein MONOS_10461 [Monocercomonoides exilis]|uniref:uncharacterized protein n=1 Tax=Monocercomonoides exilis TaxID=2049356 RepID=UPI00355A9D70|nr:hypothetical protein MONOS_10461 [Monocercomonoides exilis]|eukprot:MONOS_10461.1-p1 / transcript=MONOS_10461.1 / gene=MONOS_10461 / organism=Monocercomonoides_exilis_PA203 / gene_product=unspecified product / transcript_product=unspecified product / location=Mono_scaffold00477:14530-15191(-) / protein_length=120 / sequence_SO=supercontig / SO=protein_coding / is_pseudo=false
MRNENRQQSLPKINYVTFHLDLVLSGLQPLSSIASSSSSHFNSSPEETLFHLFPSLENGELSLLVDLSDLNVDVAFVSLVELQAEVVGSKEKEARGDDRPLLFSSRVPAIDPSDALAVE